MARIKVKVCGMRDHKNIREIVKLQPDYLGFIFFAESPRYVGWDFVLPDDLPKTVAPVGVFVNASTDIIRQTAMKTGIQTLQLHGNEPVEQCMALREEGFRVIKVFQVDDNFDFTVTKPYKKAVSMFLFDTKGKLHGGNAATFNWTLLKRYDQHIPFILSGGLSIENIGGVSQLDGMNLHALDFNSGVELNPGEKSYDKVNEVIQSMRS